MFLQGEDAKGMPDMNKIFKGALGAMASHGGVMFPVIRGEMPDKVKKEIKESMEDVDIKEIEKDSVMVGVAAELGNLDEHELHHLLEALQGMAYNIAVRLSASEHKCNHD